MLNKAEDVNVKIFNTVAEVNESKKYQNIFQVTANLKLTIENII